MLPVCTILNDLACSMHTPAVVKALEMKAHHQVSPSPRNQSLTIYHTKEITFFLGLRASSLETFQKMNLNEFPYTVSSLQYCHTASFVHYTCIPWTLPCRTKLHKTEMDLISSDMPNFFPRSFGNNILCSLSYNYSRITIVEFSPKRHNSMSNRLRWFSGLLYSVVHCD